MNFYTNLTQDLQERMVSIIFILSTLRGIDTLNGDNPVKIVLLKKGSAV